MTRPTSDERYYDRPANDLLSHKIMHVLLCLLYLASPFVAWGLEFHPFRQALHGWLMVIMLIAYAMVAFGPMYNIRVGETAAIRDRKRYLYRHYTSPITWLLSLLVLLILWGVALYESSHGSLLA